MKTPRLGFLARGEELWVTLSIPLSIDSLKPTRFSAY
ncbi:hypothetical protein NB697_001914 [Xanthomonas sacchari]|nr:hypothetical protein [Xanthomonas sacchari]